MEQFSLRLLMLATAQLSIVASSSSSAAAARSSRRAAARDRGVGGGGAVPTCPVSAPCECERRADGRLVLNCRQQGLDRVPAFRASDELVDELTLADNRLTALPPDAFRPLHVRRLDVTDNQLTGVSAAAFSGLQDHLEELRIQLSPAAEFPTRALAALTRLRVLCVVGYGGAWLPDGALASLGLVRQLRLTSGRLSGLSPVDVAAMRAHLSVLDVSGNPLRAVPSEALATLSNVSEVLLSGCQIARLTGRAFATNSTSLRRIDLSRNQLQVR